ncbi:MAG: gliding motility-associated C-terminal domain-containing protein, partial [Flavobacteriales bacterium]|nr:gliding motility-associated C-terminal domain-containing protein [Flavobacteriales bacterium]
IIIPNVITPNNDGFNDFLTFTNLEFHPGNTLVVFNRRGGKIFEKENYNNDWDGGGHAVGTYYFILTVADLDKPIKGTLTILE